MLTPPVLTMCAMRMLGALAVAACDVMEDVAIAYGFNNLVKRVPATVTAGKELPLNQITELLRGECAMAGACVPGQRGLLGGAGGVGRVVVSSLRWESGALRRCHLPLRDSIARSLWPLAC